MAITDTNRKFRMKPIIVGNNSIAERGDNTFGINTHNVPDPSAAIQIDDVNAGFLPSRLTTTERDAMNVTASSKGMMIWNITTGQMEAYNGTAWGALGGGGGGATTFAALTDTNTTGVTTGQGITWNGTAWVPANLQTTLSDLTAGTTAVKLTGTGGVGAATGATTDVINFTVGGNAVGNVTMLNPTTPKWTLNGIVDPAIYAGTPQTLSQRNAFTPTTPDATKKGYMAYVSDTGVEEYQYWNGTAWVSMGGGNPRQFASSTAVTVAAAGQPTAAEITTWAAAQSPKVVSTVVYYTGTATSTDPITYVFHVDSVGVATTVVSPAAADKFGIKPWASGTAYVAGETVTTPSGALVYRTTNGTAGTNFDATEAGAWTLVQNGPTLIVYPSSAYIYAGQIYIDQTSGVAYQFKTSKVSAGAFLASEWLAIAGNKYSAAVTWTQLTGSNTDYYQATIPAATHGIATPTTVTLAKTGVALIGAAATTGDVPFTPDQVHIAANGDVTITVVSIGPAPAASKVTIS